MYFILVVTPIVADSLKLIHYMIMEHNGRELIQFELIIHYLKELWTTLAHVVSRNKT